MAQTTTTVQCPWCAVELTQVEEHTATGLRPGWRAWLTGESAEHWEVCRAAAEAAAVVAVAPESAN